MAMKQEIESTVHCVLLIHQANFESVLSLLIVQILELVGMTELSIHQSLLVHSHASLVQTVLDESLQFGTHCASIGATWYQHDQESPPEQL